MISGVPKKFHGGALRVPWGPQATAGWVFPWETTHWVWVLGLGLGSGAGIRLTMGGDRRPNEGGSPVN